MVAIALILTIASILIAKRDAMARHDVAFVALSSGVLPVEPRI